MEQTNDDFANNSEAIAAADKAVVKLICYDYFGKEFSTGSGFIVFADNTIVTNYHVIDGAFAVEVQTSVGRSISVEYELAADKKQDIAILKTKINMGITPLAVGSSAEMNKGDSVVAIGSPLGFNNSVSSGIISAKRKESEGEVLQFSAPISSGSSGGALFNSKGEVVGITYASYEAGQNINLAIPIENATKLYKNSSEIEYKSFAQNEFPELGIFAKYPEIYEVSMNDLRNNPSKYDGKFVILTAYVSSNGDYNGLCLTDIPSYISGNSEYDYEYENDCKWSESPYMQGLRFESVSEYLQYCSASVGDFVMAFGKFDYSERTDFGTIVLEYYRPIN